MTTIHFLLTIIINTKGFEINKNMFWSFINSHLKIILFREMYRDQFGESVCGYWGSGDMCGRAVNTCSWRSGIQASPVALFPPLDKELYSSFTLGPVVWSPISANPGLNFNPGFFFFCSKVFSQIISSLLFRASNHQIVGKKNKTEFASQAFISEIKFRPNPGLT